ncbi:hypothetical protein E2C01_036135 [Portunus trituberculatus]|uniref:Uncharacterized protein n=1 Tax=Portunus trituberculatus TaxID=210409 RepID=A0A5B7FDE1_PORTR|nr:hypothetical protein [Portunus trituberculatus]
MKSTPVHATQRTSIPDTMQVEGMAVDDRQRYTLRTRGSCRKSLGLYVAVLVRKISAYFAIIFINKHSDKMEEEVKRNTGGGR